MKDKKELFKHGAAWLRADFHLHTNADKEFIYSGDEKYYHPYVNALKGASISVGVITNHNKFDFEEYKGLFKIAKDEGIFLLPGVELSVNDGANGVHVLIVFSDEWLENENDYISPFITSMFPGKAVTEYQNENGRSDKTILQLAEELKKIEKDYFLIFAHVEADKGLWHEMDGGKLSDFVTSRYDEVRKHTLGFQKVRTNNTKEKVKTWLNDWYPAEVEGSDPKSIEDIGKGKSCFIKIGAFTFDAVKFALTDYQNRMAVEPPKISHSHIQGVEFTGGIFDGKHISFSPELNTLIGIRGSGKSAVLEIIRYVLNIPSGENESDHKYKSELVRFAMKSGGKVVLHAQNRFGQLYRIERILNEMPVIYQNDKMIPSISIGETIIHKPLYFGQKDLSSSSEGFEQDLVEKLVGAKLVEIRRQINGQEDSVRKSVTQLFDVANATARIEELKKEKQDIEHRLKLYAEHGIEAKLQKRLDFDSDSRFMQNTIDSVKNVWQGLESFIEDYTLPELSSYSSKHNPELIAKFIVEYEKIKTELFKIPEHQISLQKMLKVMDGLLNELLESKQSLLEEFAEIERNLEKELEAEHLHISSDEFLKLKQRQAQVEQELSLLQKSNERQDKVQEFLLAQLVALGDLWYKEFLIIQNELAAVGMHSGALKISCEYKGDKTAFFEFLKSMLKGSSIRDATFKGIVDSYLDFIALYNDLEKAKKENLLGSKPELFEDYFNRNLAEFLTYQVPNRFIIQYHDKELKQHSLGQRASALILFVLSQHDNDVIIIDQPEDDLDNQTIYEDVIKLICKLKPHIQFILATHNPNIPVLGDAEQVIACSFAEHAVHIQSGSIDVPEQQQTIVRIMEGGKEAFERRKGIYQSWNS